MENENEVRVLKQGNTQLTDELRALKIQYVIRTEALETIAGSPPNGEAAIRLAKQALGLRVHS